MDFELWIIDPATQEERPATPDDDLQPRQEMILRAVSPEEIKNGCRYWSIGKPAELATSGD